MTPTWHPDCDRGVCPRLHIHKSMLMNLTQIRLCNIFATQAILYQFKRDVAAWKRLGCPQRTWWQIVAMTYTGFRLLWKSNWRIKTGFTWFFPIQNIFPSNFQNNLSRYKIYFLLNAQNYDMSFFNYEINIIISPYQIIQWPVGLMGPLSK